MCQARDGPAQTLLRTCYRDPHHAQAHVRPSVKMPTYPRFYSIAPVHFSLIHSNTMASPASRFTSALRIANRRYPALRCATLSRARIGQDQTRSFSNSPRWQIRTKEMNDDLLRDLKVNQGRLMEDIHYTCQWGPGERWGEYVDLPPDSISIDY